jgi:hypothetical protein
MEAVPEMRLQFSLASVFVVITFAAIIMAMLPRPTPPKRSQWRQVVTIAKGGSQPTKRVILCFDVRFKDGTQDRYIDYYWPDQGYRPGTLNVVHSSPVGSGDTAIYFQLEPPENPRVPRVGKPISPAQHQQYQELYKFVDKQLGLDSLPVESIEEHQRRKPITVPFPDGMFKKATELEPKQGAKKSAIRR